MNYVTKLQTLIKDLLVGFCLGTANIIPGVSGGTFLLIFNIYERVFSIVGNLNKPSVSYLIAFPFKLLFQSRRKETLVLFWAFLKENDFIFMFKLLIGAATAVVCLSSLMKFLIQHQFSATYSLFFGLILVSVIIPLKMIRHWRIWLVLPAVLGAALTIYVTWAVNPYEKAQHKSDYYKARYLESSARIESNNLQESQMPESRIPESGILESKMGSYSFQELSYAFLCGVAAVSAMVLPGISGSLVLILMGAYFEVISAISGLASLNTGSLLFLFSFGMGIVWGGIFFARLVSSVLKLYYNSTMSFLTGLMIGSLYALWPFKTLVVMPEQYIKTTAGVEMIANVPVYTNVNRLPEMGSEVWISLLMFVIGCLIMSFFAKKEQTVK